MPILANARKRSRGNVELVRVEDDPRGCETVELNVPWRTPGILGYYCARRLGIHPGEDPQL